MVKRAESKLYAEMKADITKRLGIAVLILRLFQNRVALKYNRDFSVIFVNVSLILGYFVSFSGFLRFKTYFSSVGRFWGWRGGSGRPGNEELNHARGAKML